MSTTLYHANGMQVTRFYGGVNRGRCYQINVDDAYIQLTEAEFKEFLEAINQ